MFDSIKNVIVKVAPTVAGLLGGPLAAVGVSALENALGLTNASPDQLQQAVMNMTPDQMLALKKQENDVKVSLAQIAMQQQLIANDDIDDARNRELKAAQIDPRLNGPMQFFSYAAAMIFICLNAGLFVTHGLSETMKGLILGLDVALLKDLFKFWFGNSGSSG